MSENRDTASRSPATTDLCDAHEDLLDAGALRALPPLFTAWGKRLGFCGPAATVRCSDDNSMVRASLETPGEGRVLVVDGGASLRCALLGGNLAVLAEKNGWAGVIVNGCVRDTAEIDACEIGVRALAAHPRRSDRRGSGERECELELGGARLAPGHWVYVDGDGVLFSDTRLH